MNVINMPGFTAEESIYVVDNCYQTATSFIQNHAAIVPASHRLNTSPISRFPFDCYEIRCWPDFRVGAAGGMFCKEVWVC